MKKLKIILRCNYVYYILLLISIIYVSVNIYVLKPISKYNLNDDKLYGYVSYYKYSDGKTVIHVKGREKVLVNYDKNIKISNGDYICVYGVFENPKDNTNFNLFNYKKYLLSNKINYIVKANKIKIIKKNTNILYNIKNYVSNRIKKCSKSESYIRTFIFADTSLIEKDLYNNYKYLGISHLFAVSGMHISLLSLLLLKILSGFSEKNRFFIISIILLIYLFLTNFTISMLRATFQFILLYINKLLKLNIKSTNIIILLFSVMLIINPYNIYNTGFLFSFLVSFTLIYFNKLISGNIITKLSKTSIISFFISLPISVNNFYQINLITIILNIIYIPFVSYILFPLSFITALFPFLDNITYFFINVFESFTILLSNINILCFSCSKMSMLFIVIYYVIMIKILNNNKFNIKNILIILILLFLIINNNRVVSSRITLIDQTTPNMIQRIIGIFERKPLISKEI